MFCIIITILSPFFLILLSLLFSEDKPKTSNNNMSESIISTSTNNDPIIYNSEVFENLIRDVLNIFMETQAQQNEQQLKMFQTQIEAMNNINSFHFLTFGFSVAVITTVIVCGLGYYFLSNNPNINMIELGNNIYTQINNQYTYIFNQTYHTFTRLLGLNNTNIPVAQAQLINNNVINADPRVIELIADDVVTHIYNQETERLLNELLNERLLAYIANPVNVDVTNAHVLGQFLIENNGII